MELLPGYKVTAKQGIDSMVGDISSKEAGLSISFDMLGDAGSYVDSDTIKKNMLWRREQTINGSRFILVYTRERYLYVTLPPSTNFFARVRNQRDLADMLLMVLTFHSPVSSPGQKGTAPK